MFRGWRKRSAPQHVADRRRRPAHAKPRPGWWTLVEPDLPEDDPAALGLAVEVDRGERPRPPGHRLAFAVASTFAALPILVVDNLPSVLDVADEPTEVVAAAAPAVEDPVTTAAPTTTTAAPTTTTTAAPTTTTAGPTTTTAAPSTTTTAAPTTTTTEAPPPPTTTTTAAPPTTTTAPPPPPTTDAAPANAQSGQATWYRQPARYAPRGCAHRTLPFGTAVTVTARSSGRSTTCTVNDRGPWGEGRVIDLDDEVFAELAPLSQGVIDVTISW